MSGEVHRLEDNQLLAVDPQQSVWLSASAGTGKTQVLSARVLRLLLRPDCDPSQILCVTFTKAGAAEMAQRINHVLARWVRLKPERLARELGDIGAEFGPEAQARARTLFASVLDCPGGGLRIDTIHAFSQWLLTNFPEEADLIPGTRPMEDREREVLARDVLGTMLEDAERLDDRRVLDAVAQFTCRKDPKALRAWLMRCANARELWFGPGAWQPPLRPHVLRLLGLPSDADETGIAQMCDPQCFDDAALQRCLSGYHAWKGKTAQTAIPVIELWLNSGAGARVGQFEALKSALFFNNGNPKLPKSPEAAFAEASLRIGAAFCVISDYRARLELASFIATSLELGRTFALQWDEAKAREGLLDFDDLIHRAADLLKRREMADWIRYKLDRHFDHVLVDEAQDTNAAQWRIIDALIEDFFAGEGAQGDKMRTIFTVGDNKQAIFGFQGTSPDNFLRARDRVRAAIEALSGNAAEIRRNTPMQDLRTLDLGRSYRTAQSLLSFVDHAIAAIGWQAMGLEREAANHVGEERPGLVTLWNPVRSNDQPADASDVGEADEAGAGEAEAGEGEEGWLARHDRALADRIAEQVHRWMVSEPFMLAKGGVRRARPGDIMVLVRRRKDLAALIVARLHARGMPVAGVDRLRLGAPLAVKDLMAALRFASQPLDDLNLANLLVSPLVGWSQEDLLAHAPRAPGIRLWHHLRDGSALSVAETVGRLRQLLALADFETPQALLQWILVGPWCGRARLVARLGREANDPVDELLNAAFAYEAGAVPSLAGFIHWFDAGEGELKRDPGEAPDLVRVMTVHGSKGLEAPIVILADATGRPGEGNPLELADEAIGGFGRIVPIPGLRKEDLVEPLLGASNASTIEALQEHWRLLYVAMTRAEEALFIGGSLGAREKEPHTDSWYARLAPLFMGDALADDLWGMRRELGYRAPPAETGNIARLEQPVVPTWAHTPIGPEPRPPRPLAPSGAGEEMGSDPPFDTAQSQEAKRIAARRGVLIHRLLERLPEIPPGERAAAARAWLGRQARDLEDGERDDIARCALAVIAEPDFVNVFGPGALAEVPLAATVGTEVIAGIADRLLIEPEQVTVIDFKTARRAPESLAAVPVSALRQMAAYAAALAVIFPGRAVRAALLYTQVPRLIEIPPALLTAHKPGFEMEQQRF